MPDPCKIAAQKTVKEIWKGVKRLTKDQTDDLVDRLRGRANTIKEENPTLTTEEASDQAAKEMSKEAEHVANKRKQQIYLQEIKNKFNDEFADRFKNKTTGYLHRIRGGEGQIQGSQDALNYQLVTEGARYLSHKDGLLDKLQKEGLKEKWWDKNRENQYEIAKACWGMKVDDPDHTKIGNIINENAEWRRQIANSEGADIGKLPNRITRTIHNPFLMRRMAESWVQNEKLKLQTLFDEDRRRELGFEYWSNKAIKYFDMKKTFPDVIPNKENWQKALRNFWERNSFNNVCQNPILQKSS